MNDGARRYWELFAISILHEHTYQHRMSKKYFGWAYQHIQTLDVQKMFLIPSLAMRWIVNVLGTGQLSCLILYVCDLNIVGLTTLSSVGDCMVSVSHHEWSDPRQSITTTSSQPYYRVALACINNSNFIQWHNIMPLSQANISIQQSLGV